MNNLFKEYLRAWVKSEDDVTRQNPPEVKLESNQYQCACCNEVFEKGWTEEEAKAELEIVFGEIPIEQCDTVCDDCYKELMGGQVDPENAN